MKIPLSIRAWCWIAYVLVLLSAPLLFQQNASLSLLSQMGTMILLGLSYNMLLGQGGMLSFGHAVYSGLGAFVAIHALNRVSEGSLMLPVTLIPLVGGLAGMVFGMLFGYVTTRRAGTTFAMITLGMVELVSACALMFPGFFGGEGGISGNRVVGAPVLGVSYGPQIEVYYLIAFWLLLATVAMYAFTKTPLGRMLNAVRDNPERAAFVGYDPQKVRYLTLILSAFFAGIAGGLSAINFEIVSAENVGALRSGTILLFTFIGGTGFFFGPIIGAVIGVLFSVLLSTYTKAWQFYLGAFFIAIVMFAPGGVAQLLVSGSAILRGGWRQLWKQLLAISVFAALLLAGCIGLVEMWYRQDQVAADATVAAAGAGIWLAAFGLAVVGLAGVLWLRPRFIRARDLALHSNVKREHP